MKKHPMRATAALICLFGAMPLAHAEDAKPAEAAPAPDWTFPTTVSLVSDYIFRGQSQTWGGPAAQLSVEADHKSGFYVGVFGSNVSDAWLPGAYLETDLYAGFRGSIPRTALGFDVGAIYYYYPGADWKESAFAGTNPNKIDTGEAYASLSYGPVSVKAGVNLTEYYGWNTNNSPLVTGFNGDPNAGVTGNTRGSYYYEANGSYEVMPSWTVSGQVGHQVIRNSSGLDIVYYKAGVTKAFDGGWSVGVFYSGTNNPDAYKKFLSLNDTKDTSNIARDTVFVNLSRAF